jgi:hypothetical protein
MVRNGNNVSICIWYEMAMVRNGYGTKWQWYEKDFHYGTYISVHTAVLSTSTAFNLVKIHLLFRIIPLIQ